MGCAVEGIVRGDLYEVTTAMLDSFGEVAGGGGVQEKGSLGLALGTVHGGIGSAVDDDVDSVVGDEGGDGGAVGDVERCDCELTMGLISCHYVGEEPTVLRSFCGLQLHFIAQLTAGACD